MAPGSKKKGKKKYLLDLLPISLVITVDVEDFAVIVNSPTAQSATQKALSVWAILRSFSGRVLLLQGEDSLASSPALPCTPQHVLLLPAQERRYLLFLPSRQIHLHLLHPHHPSLRHPFPRPHPPLLPQAFLKLRRLQKRQKPSLERK